MRQTIANIREGSKQKNKGFGIGRGHIWLLNQESFSEGRGGFIWSERWASTLGVRRRERGSQLWEQTRPRGPSTEYACSCGLEGTQQHAGEQWEERVSGICSCLGWTVFPQKILKSQLPVPVNVMLFGNGVFADDQINMRSLGWALIQYYWCPYKKEEIWTETDLYTKDNTMWRWRHRQG